MSKIRVFIYTLLATASTAVAGSKFVIVDDTQPMPWESIANPAGAVTNPVGANIDANTKSITNAGTIWGTDLRITGGSPGVGYYLAATNTDGQMTYRRGRTSFFATAPTKRVITAGGVSNMVYATVVTNDALTYDTATGEVTLPIGQWIVVATIALENYGDTGSFIQPIIEKNNTAVAYGQWVNGSAAGYYLPSTVTTAIYSDGDDKVNVAARAAGTYGASNYNDTVINQFWIEYQGE